MVAVKQLLFIMLVYVISFLPLLLMLNQIGASFWFIYAMYINNVANFFIYLALNKEFRNETKTVIELVLKKMPTGN